MIRALATALVLLTGTTAGAVQCRDQEFKNIAFTVCEVDADQADLRLFLYDPSGIPYGHFSVIEKSLNEQGKSLAFAMNAGMYHDDRAPVGYFVENGNEVMRVVTGAGPGNFGLVPNGVFCIRNKRADVIETLKFMKDLPVCSYASQSGPMLVIDGELHPRFLIDSTSRYVRNGVGTTSDGTKAIFAISRRAVTFHEFGSFFRDALGLPNALYFDGNVSRLHAPQLGRSDPGFRLGPIVGVVLDQE